MTTNLREFDRNWSEFLAQLRKHMDALWRMHGRWLDLRDLKILYGLQVGMSVAVLDRCFANSCLPLLVLDVRPGSPEIDGGISGG